MAEGETSCTLYLGNLDPVKTTRRMLYEIGIQAGPVLSVSLPSEGVRNKGFGFVEYETHEDAAYAVSLFQGNLRLFDRLLRVDFSGKTAGASSSGAARAQGTPAGRASVGGTLSGQRTPNSTIPNGSNSRHEQQHHAQQQRHEHQQHAQQHVQPFPQQRAGDLRQQQAEQAMLAQQAQTQQHMMQQTQAYAGMLAQQQALAAAQLQQQVMAAAMYVQPQAYGAPPVYPSPLQQQQQQQQQQQEHQPYYTPPPQQW